MVHSYAPDLSKISIEQYLQTLEQGELLPSRQVLKENLQSHFQNLQQQGIATVQDLITALKSKKRMADLSQTTGVPEHYLTILRREVNGLLPQPKKLSDFPGVNPEALAQLNRQGIGNTKQLYEHSRTAAQREAIAGKSIDSGELLELVKLADLSRVHGVGPVFARLLYDAGAETVEQIARADPKSLFTLLSEEYLNRGYEKVDFKLRDIQFCVQIAQRLPRTIEY